jgi:rhodanese-related sulfurtransferase
MLNDPPAKQENACRRLVLLIVITGSVLPILLYWIVYGRVTSVMPAEAKPLLRNPQERYILVDVRQTAQYQHRHVDGARSCPFDEIRAAKKWGDLPEWLAGTDRQMLLVCNTGFYSALATRQINRLARDGAVDPTHGPPRAINVRGGIQEWIASAAGEPPAKFNRFTNGRGEESAFPFKDLPWYEQWATFLGGIGFIKPAYTLLSLTLIVILWKSTAPDLVALRWAMICFFVGENFCAINYIVAGDTSYLFEYLHGLGMTLCFGFTTYAILEGFDRRVLHLADPDRRCAALGLCQSCIKYGDAPCRLRRVFLFILPACIAIAAMPLCAGFRDVSYNTRILGTDYNFSHRLVYQQYELLYCPIVSMILLTASLLVLSLKRHDPLPLAKILFAAGIGPLGFSALRMILAGTYSSNMVWFNVWEESTELIFIVGVCVVLWIFRHSLFPQRNAA